MRVQFFFCQGKSKAHRPLSGSAACMCVVGKKALADILRGVGVGGALRSPHNPLTWIYDAVIYGNASLIGGLLKVPEKRWPLSFATCWTVQAAK